MKLFFIGIIIIFMIGCSEIREQPEMYSLLFIDEEGDIVLYSTGMMTRSDYDAIVTKYPNGVPMGTGL